MSEREHNEIIYEEGWRDNAPICGDETPPDEAPPSRSVGGLKPLLISIQLALSLLAALALFVLKAMDSPAYHDFMTWYRLEMNHPLISQERFPKMDISRIASADEVRVEASADELSPR